MSESSSGCPTVALRLLPWTAEIRAGSPSFGRRRSLLLQPTVSRSRPAYGEQLRYRCLIVVVVLFEDLENITLGSGQPVGGCPQSIITGLVDLELVERGHA